MKSDYANLKSSNSKYITGRKHKRTKTVFQKNMYKTQAHITYIEQNNDQK